ncbi:MAG: toxin-antitoxin system YwqK family antitoxin [Verrucomicrobiia bacterium]
MKTTIQRYFYRTGLIREEIPLRNGQRHGVARTWHRNGQLASEEPYRNGLPHGVCRQWDEAGRLLGKYRILRGTGVQRSWHDNGRLQMEVSTVRGEFCGRNRIWLRDGTLLSERIYDHGRPVSSGAQSAAKRNGKAFARHRNESAKMSAESLAKRKHIYRVFVSSLLEKPNHCEARKWLAKKAGDTTARSLGGFTRESDAAKLVEAIYKAGATKVIAPDVYENKTADQFADCLLVRLPKDAAKRKAIRKVCAQLRRRDLGAVQPDDDIGETYLYLYLA